MAQDSAGTGISTGYPMGRLQRAVEAARQHPDPAVRARATAKAQAWVRVIDGMAGGTISVGLRTPVKDTPAWVTLEVAHGGFATGAYLAEQPLRQDELAVLAAAERVAADVVGASTDRERLNLWYLSDAGQEVLSDALRSERYRIELPEDAALLTVTWLIEHERHAEALDLVAELRPLMHRLRFAPVFVAEPRPASAAVRLRTAAAVAGDLRRIRAPARIETMRGTLGVWHPLFDRLVALWCETVDGELPRVGGAGNVEGGWPCRRWPADWARRRADWLAELRTTAARQPMSARQHGPKSDFARLRAALERCPADSSALTGRDVGWIRRALANTITKHGAPDSVARGLLRAEQAAVVAVPTFAAVAGVVAERLDRYPAGAGIGALEPVVAQVGEGESDVVPAGSVVPAHLATKAERALEAPVDELVARGVIPSGELLALVLPQITAGILAADLADPRLGAVYRQAYAAFRRRRSLLLLDLASQVRFEELPWVAAVQPLRSGSADVTAAARRALDEATMLTLRAFPHTITPNPLVGELTRLAKQAGMDLPLVSEVAADIFMGTFTDTWRRAAVVAGGLLAGTLYQRYYDLPPADTWVSLRTPARRRARRWFRAEKFEPGFAGACRSRAQEAHVGRGSPVAANGAVLEQSQILTTHNLAVLVDALDRRVTLAELGGPLADQVLDRVVGELRVPRPHPRAALSTVKNAAYAWRQAIFLLSFCTPDEQGRSVERLRRAVDAAPGLPPAFGLAVTGLRRVLAGESFDADGQLGGCAPARRFLGWSVGPHWLIQR